MRPLATWVVIAALALIGLFAARDALRRGAEPVSSPAPRLEKRAHPAPFAARPPRIDRRLRLSAGLQRLGAHGVLYLTDANCRRYLLRLPGLVWTTPQGLPGPDCTTIQPVVDERVGLAATQVDADIVEARAEGWRLRFEGNDPAFTPDGTLTFLRAGHLFEWTVRCPPGAQTVSFRGVHTLARCPRPVAGAPRRLREIVWLSGGAFAAIAGQDRYSSLLVVRDGRPTTLFRAIGARMGALEASPRGRYLTARVGGVPVVFDTTSARGPVLGLSGARAIAWSADDRLAAVAMESTVQIFRSAHPDANSVTLPLTAFALGWR